MKPTIKITTLLVTAIFLLNRCATYHLTTKSLIEQVASSQTETKFNYIIAPPFFVPGIVKGNNLRVVTVLDAKGIEHVLPVTHSTAVRITKKNNKRNTFYFDTLIIKDSVIVGKKDHFFGINIKPINLNDIKKIELQRH